MAAPIRQKIDETREILHKALADPSFHEILERFRGILADRRSSMYLLRSIISQTNGASRALAIRNAFGPSLTGHLECSALIQRYLLMQSAIGTLDQVDDIVVHPGVKRLICNEFQYFSRSPARESALFTLDSYSFWAFCKIALLRRFPAGQYQWEPSAFPKSFFVKLPVRTMPSVAFFIATQMKGFAPYIEPHMPARSVLLIEKESDKAWYRMARSVEANPSLKGLVAFSWLHSSDTYRISPHLSFVNKPFVESGAIITTIGFADQKSGFLEGSEQRKKLYESGDFKPTEGVVIWSREQMIRWAKAHPELDDS